MRTVRDIIAVHNVVAGSDNRLAIVCGVECCWGGRVRLTPTTILVQQALVVCSICVQPLPYLGDVWSDNVTLVEWNVAAVFGAVIGMNSYCRISILLVAVCALSKHTRPHARHN